MRRARSLARGASAWLAHDDDDARRRMLEIDRRLTPVRRRAFAVLAVALLTLGPSLGYAALLPFAAATALAGFPPGSRIAQTRRPELALFAAWGASQALIAAAVALLGGHGAAALAWLALPVVALVARFSARAAACGLAYTGLLIVIVARVVDASAVAADPALLVVPVALLLALAAATRPLVESDLEHRRRMLIDELTGLLNRSALLARVEELAQQSAVTGQPVGLVVADIDSFKQVNDVHGHAAGDAVLRDLARLLRHRLRAFDLAYRIGGDEFVVLLPGAGLTRATTIAEDLRVAAERARMGPGLAVTISCGVASSGSECEFAYEAVFAAADRALYEAKREGRNRVGARVAPGATRVRPPGSVTEGRLAAEWKSDAASYINGQGPNPETGGREL